MAALGHLAADLRGHLLPEEAAEVVAEGDLVAGLLVGQPGLQRPDEPQAEAPAAGTSAT